MSLGRRIEEGVASFLVLRAGVLFVLGLVLALSCLLGFQNLKLRNDYRSFFDAHNAILERTDWLSARMGDAQETAIIIYRPEGHDVVSSVSLLQYRQIAESAKALPFVVKAKSWFDTERLVALPDGASSRYAAIPFLQGVDLYTPAGLATLRRDLAAAPTVSGRYVARDQSSATVLLQLDLAQGSGSRVQKLERLEAGVRAIEKDLQRASPKDRLFLVGSTLFDYASTEILRQDAKRLLPLALLVVVVPLFLLYRSIVFTLLGLLLILLPVIATAGAAAAAGWEFSTLSISGLLLVGTLAVADIVHVANTYFIHGAEIGDRREAVRYAFAKNFWAISATSTTTMVGEVALLFSAAPPVRVMGQIVIVGVFLAWLLAVMMLPWVLLRIAPARTTGARLLRNPLSSMSAAVARRPWPSLVGFTIVAAVCVFGLSRSRVDDSMSAWFSPQTEFRQGMDLLDANYLSLRTMTLAMRVKDEDRDALYALPNVEAPAKALVEVHQRLVASTEAYWLDPVSAVRAFMTRLAEGGPSTLRPDPASIAEHPAAPSSRTLSDAGLMTQFEPGKADYLVSYFDPTHRSTFETLAAARQVERAAVEAAGDRNPQLQGTALAFADLSARNFWSMVQGSLLVLLVMTATLVLVFRSWALGLLSLIPNIAPVALVYAGLGLFGGSINMAAVSVFSVACGIVVDDTIHFILSYKRRLEAGDGAVEAIHESVGESGTGVIASTLVIGFGFLLLGLSNFQLTAEKATMVGAAIFLAFFFDVLVLPAVLVVAHRSRSLVQRAVPEAS